MHRGNIITMLFALILFPLCRQQQTAWHKTWYQFQPMRKKNQQKPTNHIAAYMKRFILLVNTKQIQVTKQIQIQAIRS